MSQQIIHPLQKHFQTSFEEIKQEIYIQTTITDLNNTTQNSRHQFRQEIAQQILQQDDHLIPLKDLSLKYNTHIETGLNEQQAEINIQIYGDNKLTEKPKKSKILIFLLELTNGFSILLWAGSFLCFLAFFIDSSDLSNLYLGSIIVFVVLLTGIITYHQNATSEAIIESFKNILPNNSLVTREGKTYQINSSRLVPGDLLTIKSGEKIPADIRIISSIEMKVDNSPLTGESEPLLRQDDALNVQNPLEAPNMVFSGTLCKQGIGKGIVLKTGDRTIMGNIAHLSQQEKQVKSPLREELDRFVVYVLIIAVFLGVLFFFLGFFVIQYDITSCVLFGIGILVSNVPEGLLGCVTISLAITAKNLAQKSVLVKNLETVEALGSTSCICTDKTGTLTQNQMTVSAFWACLDFQEGALENNQVFQDLHLCSVLCNEAQFDEKSGEVQGSATECGLLRYFQEIEDVKQTRKRFKIAKNIQGNEAKYPFNSKDKFSLIIIEKEDENNNFCVYLKGAPEKIWNFCSHIQNNNEKIDEINQEAQKLYENANNIFGKKGQRVLAFAKLFLKKEDYPINYRFQLQNIDNFPFQVNQFIFCGLISFIDPPKLRVPSAILQCRSAGIKVIMITGDQPSTALEIARQCNIIPRKKRTNYDDQEGDFYQKIDQNDAIIIRGDEIEKSFEKEKSEGFPSEYFLQKWIKKPYCVFARTTPAQKLQIVQACQSQGYICAVTGDGVNDSPAIKQADIGISMNISGSDVTKDASDMVLLDDDFASIVQGVEEGRKIFDNLKKSIVYVLVSNVPEIIPFIAFIIFQIPLPITSIYMICIDVGTDIIPSISFSYEDAEIDIMTRKPRKKNEHMVSLKLLFHAYFLMGVLAIGGGFLAYFTVFNQLGFPIKSLFGLAIEKGVLRPPKGDFQEGFGCKNCLNDDCAYFNGNFMQKKAYNCMQDLDLLKGQKEWDFKWLSNEFGDYDLRKSLIFCDEKSGKWTPKIKWGKCNTSMFISPVSGNTACFTTEALKYAQTAWFCSVVLFQFSNVICLKGRKTSFSYTQMNKFMIFGIIFELGFCLFLLYVPYVQNIFGSRPLNFEMVLMPSLPFSILIMVWEELRKYLVRNYWWFEKYSYY
ncbi:K antiporter P-type alpha subunit family protein, putative [Ichthyophthirius multifiliis]|uniref:K antiporter P-type alpha subunit family protein, putative n=1 Tax=Ichthyophthirius multifiliis TaxID=5932 RepID=G0QK49_ICHMU|nr:K antiporter P-type alpha subunit family protein, putative [Ichthyophthirius multifiliis]EGR34406.1 K antiporter P-type alpha subunit family protein, putative [Ichthyophthirius multifiliis]|eukprot:XP_004039710.1 K antiporter P-type alpha subunit family protein, putative [Ichthyophthirius multifiliis]